jgi:hypothetical protein
MSMDEDNNAIIGIVLSDSTPTYIVKSNLNILCKNATSQTL